MSIWALRFILWFVCILLTQPQNRFMFLFPFHIADIAVAGALGFHLLSVGKENIPFIRTGPASIMGLVLMVCALISNYAGPLQPDSSWNAFIDIVFKNVMILLLIEALCTNTGRVWAVQATVFIATLWWVKAGIRLSISGMHYAGDRLMGPGVSLVENPNGYAYMMCVILPLQLYFYQQARGKWWKYGLLALAITSVFIILRTGSRTGLLALLVLSVFLLPKYFAKHKKALIIAGIAGVMFSGSIGALNMERFKTLPQSIKDYFSADPLDEKNYEQMTQDEQSSWERSMKNKHTKALIWRYPVFGVGMNPPDGKIPDDLPYAKGQVHNEWLMAGKQMGIFGIGLWFGFVYLMWTCGRRVEKHCKGWWPEIADLGWTLRMQSLAFLVGGSFSPLPWNVMHLILAACASALWGIVRVIPRPVQGVQTS